MSVALPLPKPIPPRTILRLRKLWPHARKHGLEIGQLYRVGYYCRHCGSDVVWLVNARGEYNWTATRDWITRHFDVAKESGERSLYGKGKAKIGELRMDER